MRASTDQVLTATTDAVEAARRNAAGLVSTGADLVSSTLDKGASAIEGGISTVTEKAPTLSLAANRQPRRHRVRTALIGLVVVVVIMAVAKKLLSGSDDGSSSASDTPRPGDSGHNGATASVPDDDAVPAGSG